MIKHDRVLDSESMIGLPVLSWADGHEGTVVLESTMRDRIDFRSYVFAEPSAIVAAGTPEEVQPCLAEIEHAVRGGLYAAGYLAYEAGFAFETIGRMRNHTGLPLLWFGIYEDPLTIDHRNGRVTGGSPLLRRSLGDMQPVESSASTLLSLRPTMSEEEYLNAFNRVQDLIADGDTYQVNLTFKLKGTSSESPVRMYDRMRHNQRVKYGAFLNLGARSILSCSPELFFRRNGTSIVLKPMKGTTKRGRTSAEDQGQRQWLQASSKNRAENMMIVDLLRNDAGRIADPGTVRVERFFDIERYETVFQATSTIRARLRRNVTIGELVRCLFPSGSVTGAPKIRTMQIIRELEREPRGVYTGGIGFFGPERKAMFNVAIRTAVLDKSKGSVEFGVGSGVVHDSTGADEYAECLAKARFVEMPAPTFDLLETIRWDPAEGFGLLRLHLHRLKDSAGYFGFCYNSSMVRDALENVSKRLRRAAAGLQRVRLLLSYDGEVKVESRPLEALHGIQKISLSRMPVNSEDRLLFHKTTSRSVYETALKLAEQTDHFDVVFCNEKRQLTEGARSNIVLRFDNQYFTPPVETGILPGTFREWLLRGQHIPLKEKTLYPDDLHAADEIFVCNAVRGLIKVKLAPKEER